MSSFVVERDYLDFERRSELRHEYVAGHVIARTGGNHPHNIIVGNLSALVSMQLRGRPCEVYAVAMRVKVARAGMYAYPDVVARCGEPRFEDAQMDTLLNPCVIVEVLSDDRRYDRGEKFAHYRRPENAARVHLVAQDKVRIEHYRRDGAEWILSEISDPTGTLHLASIDCHIGIDAIYEKVDFSPLPDDGRQAT
jgi:Uma2 family endonuclease